MTPVPEKPAVPTFSCSDLYKGWMIGFSYTAIKNLYFKKGTLPKSDGAQALREWLHTYIALIDGIQPSNLEALKKGLESMVKDTEAGTRKKAIKINTFDIWFDGLKGDLRAKIPSAFHAAGFASSLSALTQPGNIKDQTSYLTDLHDSLSKLKVALPKDTYSVVNHDIQELLNRTKTSLAKPDEITRSVKGQYRDWAGLILGDINVGDILSERDWVILWVLVSIVGIVLFGAVALFLGFVVFGSLIALTSILGITTANLTLGVTKDLFGLIQSLLTILTGVGLSISLLAKRSLDWLKSFSSRMIVYLAKKRTMSSMADEVSSGANGLPKARPTVSLKT